MTERRVVVLAFFAFLTVGAVAILVFASQPVSHPSIQSGRGATTTQPHPHATTSPTTPGTLPQPPTEVKGESATSATANPAPTTAAPTAAPPTTAPPTTAPPTTAPPTTAPPTAAPPAAAPPAGAPPAAAAPTTPPTTAPPTTEPPTTNKEKPIPPGQAKK